MKFGTMRKAGVVVPEGNRPRRAQRYMGSLSTIEHFTRFSMKIIYLRNPLDTMIFGRVGTKILSKMWDHINPWPLAQDENL